MAEVMEDRGDQWSLLPPELLHLIYRKLPDTGDFLRFRAVCKAWRDGAPVSDQPPQLPWILEHRGTGLQARQQLRFYSHSSGRMYSVRAGGRSWLLASGACQGHAVATVDLSRTVMYNPFTGEGRALPPAPYKPWHDGVFHVVDDGEAGCLVVNTSAKTRRFAYCRPGVDAGWNVFDGREDMRHSAYHGGRFFVNTAAGETLAIEAATCAVEAVVPPPPGENFATARGDFLVGSRGKLLRAVQHPRDGNQAASAADYYVNMYQLDVRGGGKAAWSKVETIGDAVLFFDDHGHGFSLEPNDAAGLRRDCVYFVHEKRTWVEFCEYRFLCRYSMKDGRVDKTVQLADTFGNTWVVPSL
ncbi:uncharacterized protein LOC133921571 [Phragmites australis]|uniref:uncharacterized protein LOC133921571 n=1 Tax=Phragmites australis TaxID=29695 RepID=UPI002D782D41|nr:uncharacterized protein LOC133921571 [Phragmites australis]